MSLQARMFHRPHTLLCGNLGGALCCGYPYIPCSANASGETSILLVDEIELICTCSINDDVKALILTCGLGVWVFVFVQSFMYYSLGLGCLSLALGEGHL